MSAAELAAWQAKVRDDMAVLRGDPDQVAAVADALEFDHKYTSGVIAWAPEDQPSDRDIDRVLDEFEQSAWAGLGAGNRTLRIARDRLVYPLDPFGRVEPPVAQLHEPSGFQGFRREMAVTYLY